MLSSAAARNSYTGNGAVSDYDYDFKIFDRTHLAVYVRDTDDAPTLLAIDTDYTVSDVGEESGGSISLVSSGQAWLTGGNLTNNYKIEILRSIPITQGTDFANQEDFYPETHEERFDYQTMIDQMLKDALDRCLKLPASLDPADYDVELEDTIADNADTVIAVKSTGDGFTYGPTITNIAAAEQYAQDAEDAQAAAEAAQLAAEAAQTAADAAVTDAEAAQAAAEAAADAAAAAVVDVQTDIDNHIADLNNPHAVDLDDLGVTATATELNYVGGVTSAIQTQLDGKQAAGSYLTDLSGLDTDDLAEGATNKYYDPSDVDSRADARIAAASIGDLSDVDLSTPPTDGQTLVWATNKFVPGAASGGGGGGGGSLRWVEGASAPILSLESGLEVYAFTPALAQELFTVVRVPTSYTSGSPITLKVLWTCASTANNALLLAQATLIRSEVDDITSTTNQRTTTNSAITMAATNDLEPQKVSLDISSSIGEINAVAISAGDIIKVRVYESSSTCADDIKLIPDASEVTFT